MTNNNIKKIAKVALIGRRNVGKSSLFNALSKSKTTITDNTPGLTRDFIEAQINFNGHEFILYDTPGLDLEIVDELNKKISKRTLQFLSKEVDIIIFVYAAPTPTPFDLDYLHFIRKQNFLKPIIYLVNKIDNPDTAAEILTPFFEAKLINLIPVSALGRWNLNLLVDKIFEELNIEFRNIKNLSSDKLLTSENNNDYEKQNDNEHLSLRKRLKISKENEQLNSIEDLQKKIDLTTLTIVGKPNAGKSSLFNRFISGPNPKPDYFERALVSDIPGTTRDSIDTFIDYNNKKIKIIDTAGLRRPTHLNNEKYKIEFYSTKRTEKAIINSTVVVLVVDALVGLTDLDKRICSMIEKHGKAVIIAISKWDALKNLKQKENSATQTEDDYINVYKDRLDFLFPHVRNIPLIFCSSHTGQGVSRILTKAIELNEMMFTKISTSELNQNLKSWCSHQPVNSRKVKVKFATQVSLAPPTFTFFVNFPKLFSNPLKNYFDNCIRKHFKLKGIPIVIIPKEST